MTRIGRLRGFQRVPELPGRWERGTTLLRVSAAVSTIGSKTLLAGVDLELRAGELVALIGPNGAGKSTLLSALAGDLKLDSGRVVLAGRPLEDWSASALALRMSVLPQRTEVTFPFTTAEVVRMGRAPWARTSESELDESIVAEALQSTDVAHLADRTMPTLSGGEAGRVALARVLAQSCQILLLDEPTAALDIHHQEQCLGLVRRRVDEGAGAVVVLHDLEAAAAHADRIVVLDAGRVVGDGPPHAVLTDELIGHVYRGAVEVVPHPITGKPLVITRRSPIVC